METIDVAIVEDVDEIREALRVLINGSQGFTCTQVFASAEAAITELPADPPDVGLIDIHLPGKSGIDCVQELKARMSQTQFMMCTVYDDDEHIFDALKAGATGYILKRTSPAQILEAIRELYSGGSPMSSEVARRVINSIQKKNSHSAEAVEVLTDREKEILDHLALGFLYKEIADKLSISKETVKKHIHNIYEKLHVQTRTEALNKAFQR